MRILGRGRKIDEAKSKAQNSDQCKNGWHAMKWLHPICRDHPGYQQCKTDVEVFFYR
jgi:hypothetical protein